VLALVYSPDGRWLASEDADATLVIWDTVAKKQFTLKTPRSNFVFYAALAVSPDSKWLVSTNGRDALIWNTETWQQVRKLAHRDMVWSLAFSPVGDLLATASYHSSEVKLYRTSTWEEIAPSNELAEKQLTEEQKGGSWVRAVAFSPNGQWLARAGDSITIWDMTAGTKLYGAENFKARSLAFSPDNQTLIAGGEAGGLTLITLAGGMNAKPFAEQTAQVREVQFSTDGRYVVSARGDPGSSSEVVSNGVVSVWGCRKRT
jgi:WD40 repeat protein